MACRGVCILSRCDSDGADDELRNYHERTSCEEDFATAEFLNDVEGDGCGADVDEGGDELDEEGVGDCSEGFEEDDAEVEDEIDALRRSHQYEGSCACRAELHGDLR